MYYNRVIPVLLLNKRDSLIKTRKFKAPCYIGDPLNIVKIFNDKEVDELILLDINASFRGMPPDFEYIKEIAGECFMPVCYGGGISSLDDIAKLIRAGVEKISLNYQAYKDPAFVSEAAKQFGSSTVVVSADVRKDFWGNKKVAILNGSQITNYDPVAYCIKMQEMGAGEIFLNSVDREGTMKGLDTGLIKKISSEIQIPLIACGGAGSVEHIREGIEAGASAVAAGSMFVYTGEHRAVLISYPSGLELINN